MDTTVYLPIHKRTPVALVHTLAATVAQVARQVNQQPVFSSECTLNSTQGSSQLKATPVAAQIDQSNATSSTTPAPRETLPRRLLNKVNALRVRISSSL
jgi:hypothetical protein